MKLLQISVNSQHQYLLVCLLDKREQVRHLCDGLDPLADAIEAFMGIDYVDAWEQAVALSKAAYGGGK